MMTYCVGEKTYCAQETLLRACGDLSGRESNTAGVQVFVRLTHFVYSRN